MLREGLFFLLLPACLFHCHKYICCRDQADQCAAFIRDRQVVDLQNDMRTTEATYIDRYKRLTMKAEQLEGSVLHWAGEAAARLNKITTLKERVQELERKLDAHPCPPSGTYAEMAEFLRRHEALHAMVDRAYAEPTFKFRVDQNVEKYKGDYYVYGKVKACYQANWGKNPVTNYYVVQDINGVQYILRENQISAPTPIDVAHHTNPVKYAT